MLRLCSDLPAVSGKALVHPRDALCTELLTRTLTGTGEHLWILTEAYGLSSGQVLRALARAAHCEPEQVRCAGARDRTAKVRQWFSIPRKLLDHDHMVKNAGCQNALRVKEVQADRLPVSASQIKALSWELIVHAGGEHAGYSKARAICDRLRSCGVPNWLGSARLGPDGQHAKWGKLYAQGKRPPAGVKTPAPKTCIRAFQAQLFNRYLAKRIEMGTFNQVVPGELLQVFCQRPPVERAVEALAIDSTPEQVEHMQRRCQSGEAVPLAPLFGSGMQAVRGQAAVLEAEILAEAGVERLDVEGERRPLRWAPLGLVVESHRHDLFLRFSCDPEVYIASLVEELLQPEGHL